MHFFSPGKTSIFDIRLLNYASSLWCVSYSFEKHFNYVQKKKKISFDFSGAMSPVILCGAAKHVVIKCTPEPACHQACLCRFLLKVSQRSCKIFEWMNEHTASSLTGLKWLKNKFDRALNLPVDESNSNFGKEGECGFWCALGTRLLCSQVDTQKLRCRISK